MTISQPGPVPAQQPPFRFQFPLVHLFYAVTLCGAALAAFGGLGLGVAIPILAFWAYVYSRRSRPRALVEGCFTLLICWCLIGPSLRLLTVSGAREAARRTACGHNLKQIALALHNYHDRYGTFPPAFLPGQDGKPMHSWRVLILPFLDRQDLYQQYSFQEPWDGPNNRRLLIPVPMIYRCPSDVRTGQNRRDWTSYVAVVGPRTAWPGSRSSKVSEFTDGTSNTILVVEDPSRKIPWMEPRDLVLDEAIEMLDSRNRRPAGSHPGGRQAALADGAVTFVPHGLPQELVTGLLIIDDGMRLPMHDLWSLSTVAKRSETPARHRVPVFVALALFPLLWVWRKRETNEALVENAERVPLVENAERVPLDDEERIEDQGAAIEWLRRKLGAAPQLIGELRPPWMRATRHLPADASHVLSLEDLLEKHFRRDPGSRRWRNPTDEERGQRNAE
jgi:hypothetical protein